MLLVEHFDPEGKRQTKSLSLAISGRASVCLLIAPLEVQWDSFTVDGLKTNPDLRQGSLRIAQNGRASHEIKPRRLLFAECG